MIFRSKNLRETKKSSIFAADLKITDVLCKQLHYLNKYF